MADTKPSKVDPKYLDIIIRMALRDVDPETLAMALVGQDEATKELILRNMSRRAGACLEEGIQQNTNAAPESVRAGMAAFTTLLQNAADRYARLGIKGGPISIAESISEL